MQLKNKKILVIGGSSGIGFSIATAAAESGAQVIMAGRDETKLKAAVAKLTANGGQVEGRQLNAFIEADLNSFFENLTNVDHLVSMVGGSMQGGFIQPSITTIREAIEVKFFTNLKIARLAAPKIIEGGSMTFTAGSGGRPQNASGAIIGNMNIRVMVEGLAFELAPKIRVNAVAPTWMDTPLWRNVPRAEIDATKNFISTLIPLKRTATMQEVAAAYIFLMRNNFVTGQTISVDGGITLGA